MNMYNTYTYMYMQDSSLCGLLLTCTTIWSSPNSLMTNESVCTLSENLYVSQHTRTGTLNDLAASATILVPMRDMT